LRVHTDPVLLTYIAEIADEPLVLDPNNLHAETRTNTWSLNAHPGERATLTADQVVAAFADTAAKLSRRVSGLGSNLAATFYVWYDAQSGQLCCSTTSKAEGTLPFGGAYTTTTSLEPIIAAFLDDPQPGFIPWSQLTTAEPDAAEPAVPALSVWVQPIGGDTPDPSRS
jgi:hypothetical protein